MLENTVQLLSSNKGYLFAEVPQIGLPDGLLGLFEKDLNRMDGLTARIASSPGGRTLGIIKEKELPKGSILFVDTCAGLAELAKNAKIIA